MATDETRLPNQIYDIYKVMLDGGWWTLQELEDKTGHPQASISSQMRRLGQKRYGSQIITKRFLSHSLFEYKMAAPKNSKMENLFKEGKIRRKNPVINVASVQDAHGDLTTALIMMKQSGTEQNIVAFVQYAHHRLQVELDKISYAHKHGENLGRT